MRVELFERLPAGVVIARRPRCVHRVHRVPGPMHGPMHGAMHGAMHGRMLRGARGARRRVCERRRVVVK